MKVYHILEKEVWGKAEILGYYSPSSLDKEGFIHCSTKEQLLPTLNRRFLGKKNLLLISINTKKVKQKIVFEDLNKLGEKHPHIYGVLDINAVISTLPLIPEENGEFKQKIS